MKVPKMTDKLASEAPNPDTATVEDMMAYAKKVLATVETGKLPNVAKLPPDYDEDERRRM